MTEWILNFYESLPIRKKKNFTARLILEIKLTHYLAFPDMSDHTHLKWLTEFFAFKDVQSHTKIKFYTSKLASETLHLKNPAFWLV